MTDMPRRERAVRAAYKVEHDLYGVENLTLTEIRRELEAARKSVLAVLATARKDWQIAQAQALLKEIEREMGAWAKVASSAAAGRLGEVADLGVEQAMASLGAGGGLGFSLGSGPVISRDFVAVASQTLPDLVTNVSADLTRKIGSILRQAVLAQETPLEAMQKIGTFTGKGVFASAFERGEAIVRTEYGRIAQTANYTTLSAIARDNAGLHKEWSCVVDGRAREGVGPGPGRRQAVRHRRLARPLPPRPEAPRLRVGHVPVRLDRHVR